MADEPESLPEQATEPQAEQSPLKARLTELWAAQCPTSKEEHEGVWTAIAIVFGLLVAVGAFLTLYWSYSSDCFLKSVAIVVEAEGEPSLKENCRGFEDFRRDLDRRLAERDAAIADEEVFAPEVPNTDAAEAALLVWMSLFAATAAVAAYTFVKSWYIMREGPTPAPMWRQLGVGVLVAFVGMAALWGVFALVDFVPSVLHKAELDVTTLLVLGLSLPAAVGLVTVWLRLRSDEPSLKLLGAYRSVMQKLVALLGAVLSLGVLTTAARFEALAAIPGGQPIPGTGPLLYGAVYAVVIAVFYMPTHQLWVSRTNPRVREEVKKQCAPFYWLPGTYGYRPPERDAKKQLKEDLGVAGGWKGFQGSFAVLSPVIAAALSSLFG